PTVYQRVGWSNSATHCGSHHEATSVLVGQIIRVPTCGATNKSRVFSEDSWAPRHDPTVVRVVAP
ncbi:unnamed protein product, partial [Musa acuminata var. zebrina]